MALLPSAALWPWPAALETVSVPGSVEQTRKGELVSVSPERLVRNQVVFREVNERILEIVSPEEQLVMFVCECSRPDCDATVELTRPEYEGVRSIPNYFVVAPGHEMLEVDRVLGYTGIYTLVEKKESGAGVAAKTDPRTRR